MANKSENGKLAGKKKVENTQKRQTTKAKSTKPDEQSLEKLYKNRASGLCERAPSKKKSDAKTKKSDRKGKKKTTDGVTENAPYSHLARYRMVSNADNVINSSGS